MQKSVMTCCMIVIRWGSMTVTGERQFEKRLFPAGLADVTFVCLRDHDQMEKHDCYWRAKVRKTTWVPDQDPALRLREFLPSIKIGPRDDRFSAEMPSGELFGAFCDRGT